MPSLMTLNIILDVNDIGIFDDNSFKIEAADNSFVTHLCHLNIHR